MTSQFTSPTRGGGKGTRNVGARRILRTSRNGRNAVELTCAKAQYVRQLACFEIWIVQFVTRPPHQKANPPLPSVPWSGSQQLRQNVASVSRIARNPINARALGQVELHVAGVWEMTQLNQLGALRRLEHHSEPAAIYDGALREARTSL